MCASYTPELSWWSFLRPPSISRKQNHTECKIHIILQLFPNCSMVLEQIHIFKASIMAEL